MTLTRASGRPAGFRRAASVLAATLCLASAGGCAREPLLSVEIVDLAGLVKVTGPENAGQPMLVNYWATWCGPCVAELPELVEVAHAHRGEARVLAVSMDLAMPANDAIKGPADVEAFARQRDIDLPILVYDGTVEEACGLLGLPGPLPYTVALDRSGKVVDTQTGQATRERFEEMLEAAGR